MGSIIGLDSDENSGKKNMKREQKIMKVGIDASRFGHREATGVEWYSYHLLNAMIPLLGREHHAKVVLYSPDDFTPEEELPFNVEKRILPAKKWWTVLTLSWEMLRNPVDLLFIPSHVFPYFLPKKAVITIHDVAFRHFPQAYSKKAYRYLEHSTKRAVKKAWKIIVPSLEVKKDLIDIYQCDAAKIAVIPHGAPEVPRLKTWTESETKAHLEKFSLTEGDLIILYVGRIELKKNLVRLIEAFARFSGEFPDWKLVLCGKDGFGADIVKETATMLELGDSVKFTGYVSEEDKLFLLDRARMLAFVSLAEGFGLPILEGFAVRRPVLTSKGGAMEEVAGNAAYLVNPEKVEEISVGLKRLASDAMLINRLIAEGEKRLKDFSWEATAKKTFEVLFD